MPPKRKPVGRRPRARKPRTRKSPMPEFFTPDGVSRPYQYLAFKRQPPVPSYLPANPPESLSPQPLHGRPSPQTIGSIVNSIPNNLENSIPMEYEPYTRVPTWVSLQPTLTPTRPPPINEYVVPPVYPPSAPYAQGPPAMQAESSPSSLSSGERSTKSILSSLVDLFLPPAPSQNSYSNRPINQTWNHPMQPNAAQQMGFNYPNTPPGYFSPIPGPLYTPPHPYQEQFQGYVGPQPSAPPLGYGYGYVGGTKFYIGRKRKPRRKY
jgi:hypothetical protein